VLVGQIPREFVRCEGERAPPSASREALGMYRERLSALPEGLSTLPRSRREELGQRSKRVERLLPQAELPSGGRGFTRCARDGRS
jgi:hypothetical protein